MNIYELRLINFRNYYDLKIEFFPGINIIYGDNAQGKTNLLEAINLISTGKSFRTNREKEMINFNKDKAYVGARVLGENFEKLIEIKLDKNETKKQRINGKEVKSQKELYDSFKSVVFSPDDINLIKDGPNTRRNYIDNLIINLKPTYQYNLNRYNKILFQRNNLLKSNYLNLDKNLIDIFNLQLSKIASLIILERISILKKIERISKAIHSDFTANAEKIEFQYISTVNFNNEDSKEIQEKTLNMLRENEKKDIEAKTTQIGPHRDDILIKINDKDIRAFGSQGQKRSAVLTMKLSEVELIKNETNHYPILLLDDVYSELDQNRKNYLNKLFKNVQTFITTTDIDQIGDLSNLDITHIQIKDGTYVKR